MTQQGFLTGSFDTHGANEMINFKYTLNTASCRVYSAQQIYEVYLYR